MERIKHCLYLHKKIYDRDSIQEAIEDYKEICKMELSQEVEYYCLAISEAKVDLELVKQEFTNYVIGLGVKSRRCFRL